MRMYWGHFLQVYGLHVYWGIFMCFIIVVHTKKLKAGAITPFCGAITPNMLGSHYAILGSLYANFVHDTLHVYCTSTSGSHYAKLVWEPLRQINNLGSHYAKYVGEPLRHFRLCHIACVACVFF